jgi:pimeloyl-ACP methyl ester carboxylesterase
MANEQGAKGPTMATQLGTIFQPGGITATGFATPKEDKTPQLVRVPPKRVIPIVFLPGIMGSNLRVSPKRQKELKISNNSVWRPDKVKEVGSLLYSGPTRRQLLLDQAATEVDSYDPVNNPTGNSKETSDERNSAVADIKVSLPYEKGSPVLVGEPLNGCNRLSIEERARHRGWGEVFFSSYRNLLESLEQTLNGSHISDRLKGMVGVDPALWQAHPVPALRPLTEQDIHEALSGQFLPVHAMGYNWLQSNHDSALLIRNRIEKLIEEYQRCGFRCEKVIVLTHSMGGLVARALAHPKIGDMSDKILGVVHGVLPAVGAPAAYKRMRCGFEEKKGGLDPVPKIIGNKGSEVTAVLGNSPSGLQLLPCGMYGNGWLQIRHNGILFDSFPKNGDPYEEIYKVRNRWYGLIREEWLNPAEQSDATFKRACGYLNEARDFHETLGDYYHPRTYAHYGADPRQPTWESVVWEIHRDYVGRHWRDLSITEDDDQGKIEARERLEGNRHLDTKINLGSPYGSGDQTVPLRSAEHQLLEGRMKGVFRQTGYEHQDSYNNERALNSTLYSVLKIAARMWWADGK